MHAEVVADTGHLGLVTLLGLSSAGKIELRDKETRAVSRSGAREEP